ncbi:TonB-dependent receptor [Sphingomonas sp. MS122]|uniref:TonB-dependent receptor n=1 Tax=Sphingomonas sp. MS122 TaxID=3412683 RepID=UPI003C309E7F
MRRLLIGLAAAGILTGAMPAIAQDEIVVTGMRRLNPGDGDNRPVELVVPTPAAVQMLRRTADFAVQQVIVVSDTVEEADARKEVQAMIRKAIDLSAGSGVQLASGEFVVEPLTPGNYKDLKIEEIDEDELSGEATKFLVKVPLAPGIDAKAALARIDKFIKAVPAAGRAQMKAYSELTLSVVDPEQYRGAIIDLVAKDTAVTSGRFGAGYGVEVTGLDKPVQWKRASLTEVQLFLPSNSTVRPRN